MRLKVSLPGVIVSLFLLTFVTISLKVHSTFIEKTDYIDVLLENLPYNLNGWKGKDTSPLDAHSKSILLLDRYLRRSYEDSEQRRVFLYIGYWKKQTGETQAGKHSPALCLPANGWKITQPEHQILTSIDGTQVKVSSLIGTQQTRSSLFKYWFFGGKDYFPDETSALLKTSVSILLARRNDGGIIELETTIDSSLGQEMAKIQAEKTLQDFAALLLPELRKLIDSAENVD